MQEILEIEYQGVEENQQYNSLLKNVLEVCFQTEKLDSNKIYVNIILTTPEEIQKINKTYRNIDKPTDVLSFPMFEQEELKNYLENDDCNIVEVLGDIVISIERVKEQAKEYEHSFERELAYMAVHGFYHLMGYDHIEENDKKQMRQKEEIILEKIGLKRFLIIRYKSTFSNNVAKRRGYIFQDVRIPSIEIYIPDRDLADYWQ